MDKTELQSLIMTGVQSRSIEIDAEKEALVYSNEQAKLVFEAHEQATNLANQLFDHYGSKVVRKERPRRSTIYRYSPIISLGEIDPSNLDGLTHGFVRLSTRSITSIPEARTIPRLIFKGRRLKVPDGYSGGVVTGVAIDLYAGCSDGTDLRDTGDRLGTRDSVMFSSDRDKARVQLEDQLRRSELTVDVLKFLVADADI